jgi:hypothetical protein
MPRIRPKEKTMKRGMIAAVSCLLSLAAPALGPVAQGEAPATQPAGKLVLPNHGLAIGLLDVPARGPQQVLVMFLPPSGGFAPNVRVMKQAHPGTLDEYVAQSRVGLKGAGWKVISETRPAKDTVVIEYAGPIDGRALHWYARGVQREGYVYLATATALEAQWQKVSERLKGCVDSLELLQQRTKPRAPAGQ